MRATAARSETHAQNTQTAETRFRPAGAWVKKTEPCAPPPISRCGRSWSPLQRATSQGRGALPALLVESFSETKAPGAQKAQKCSNGQIEHDRTRFGLNHLKAPTFIFTRDVAKLQAASGNVTKSEAWMRLLVDRGLKTLGPFGDWVPLTPGSWEVGDIETHRVHPLTWVVPTWSRTSPPGLT